MRDKDHHHYSAKQMTARVTITTGVSALGFNKISQRPTNILSSINNRISIINMSARSIRYTLRRCLEQRILHQGRLSVGMITKTPQIRSIDSHFSQVQGLEETAMLDHLHLQLQDLG